MHGWLHGLMHGWVVVVLLPGLEWGGVGLVRLDLSLGGSCCGGDVIKMPMFE